MGGPPEQQLQHKQPTTATSTSSCRPKTPSCLGSLASSRTTRCWSPGTNWSWSTWRPLPWLVSSEFLLADEEAARRMRCFKRSLFALRPTSHATQMLLYGVSTSRRWWRCVGVVLDRLREDHPGEHRNISQPALRRAILDAVHGEPGCTDGRILPQADLGRLQVVTRTCLGTEDACQPRNACDGGNRHKGANEKSTPPKPISSTMQLYWS